VKVLHPYNCEYQDKGYKLLQDDIEDKNGNIYTISEVVIYKDFDPKDKFMIYLYAYTGNFKNSLAEFTIYHHKKGYLDTITSDSCKINYFFFNFPSSEKTLEYLFNKWRWQRERKL